MVGLGQTLLPAGSRIRQEGTMGAITIQRPPGMGDVDWGTLLQRITDVVGVSLGGRDYAGIYAPRPQPPTYSGPPYEQPPFNTSYTPPPSAQQQGGLSSLLVLGAVGLALVMILKNR